MPATHLTVIFCCKQYETTRAAWQAATWPQRLPEQINYLLMTGQGDGQIDADGVLRLPVSDGYNELIDKTQALFDWFLAEREEPWLVKCDDDVWLSPAALQAVVTNEHPYAGAYGHDYLGGPLYILHRETIAQMGRLRDFLEPPNLAEDVAVGAAARDIGLAPKSLPLNPVFWYHHKHHALDEPHSHDIMFCFSRHNHEELMRYAEKNYITPA